MNHPSVQCIEEAVCRALAEDVFCGDVTTSSLFPDGVPARASIVARHSMVIAGIVVAREVFRAVDPTLGS